MKLKIFGLVVMCLAVCLIFSACNSDSGGKADPADTHSGDKETKNLNRCSTPPVAPSSLTAGCEIRLITPAPCGTVDVANGSIYAFTWSIAGSGCVGPFKFQVVGSPYDPNSSRNAINWPFTNNATQAQVTANSLAVLSSDTGVYQWLVTDANNVHPASQSFQLNR